MQHCSTDLWHGDLLVRAPTGGGQLLDNRALRTLHSLGCYLRDGELCLDMSRQMEPLHMVQEPMRGRHSVAMRTAS